MEITKEILEKYYNSHTYKECREFFSISDKKLRQLLSMYKIKHKTQTFDSITQSLTKEDLVNIYINENKSKKEVQESFHLSQKMLDKILKFYDIKKSKEKVNQLKSQSLSNAYKNESYKQNVITKHQNTCLKEHGDKDYNNENKRKKTCLEKYGVENYTQCDKFKEKSKETCNNKYGCTYYAQSKQSKLHVKELWNNKSKDEVNLIINKAKNTKREKYGDENYNNSLKIALTKEKRYGSSKYTNNDKTKQTCLKKYGVSYPCMRKEARLKGNNSKPNKLFEEELLKSNICYEKEFNIDNFSYDFKVGNNLIEIDPTITHNVDFSPFGHTIDKKYHLNKTEKALSNNYNCIHMFDWDNKESLFYLLQGREKIYARQCIIKEVPIEEANTFINTYHIQRYAKDNIRLGLYYQDNLVSIMTFGKPRYNKRYQYEIIRYCSSLDVVGGSNKLFKKFLKEYKPTSIISYCDLSKFQGKTYEHLGFNLSRVTKPNCHWYNIKTKQHITNNLLVNKGFDTLFNENNGNGTSNEELMLTHGFVRVYDCGQKVYIWEAQ